MDALPTKNKSSFLVFLFHLRAGLYPRVCWLFYGTLGEGCLLNGRGVGSTLLRSMCLVGWSSKLFSARKRGVGEWGYFGWKRNLVQRPHARLAAAAAQQGRVTRSGGEFGGKYGEGGTRMDR